MHFVWSIITLFWVKILSLEHHDAMKCDLKSIASYEHQPGPKYGGMFKDSRYLRLLNIDDNLNTNNVFDCHCITKTKVRFSIERMFKEYFGPSCTKSDSKAKTQNSTNEHKTMIPNVLFLHDCDILEIDFGTIKSSRDNKMLSVEKCFQENSSIIIENIRTLYFEKPNASVISHKFSHFYMHNLTMKSYGNYQNINFKNVNALILDNVKLQNFDVYLVLNNEKSNTKLKIASSANVTRYNLFDIKDNNPRNKSSIKIIGNNFGLINQYRINLLNILWINRSSDDRNSLSSWNVSNLINFEMVINKFSEVVANPIVYLFYKAEADDKPDTDSFISASLAESTFYSHLISDNLVPKITPSAIILDISRKADEEIENIFSNETCNCTFYRCLLLRNISLHEDESSNLVDKNFINSLTEDEKNKMNSNVSVYISRCRNQCEDVKKELADLRRPPNINSNEKSFHGILTKAKNTTYEHNDTQLEDVIALAKFHPEDELSKNQSKKFDQEITTVQPDMHLQNNKSHRNSNTLPVENRIEDVLSHLWQNVSTQLTKMERTQLSKYENVDKDESTKESFWNSFSQVLSNRIINQNLSSNGLNEILTEILNETDCCKTEKSSPPEKQQPKNTSTNEPILTTSTASPNISYNTESAKRKPDSTSFTNQMNFTSIVTKIRNEFSSTEAPKSNIRNRVQTTTSRTNLLKIDSKETIESATNDTIANVPRLKNDRGGKSKNSGSNRFINTYIYNLLISFLTTQLLTL